MPTTDPQAITEYSLPSQVRISTVFSDGFNRSIQAIVRNFTNTAKPHLIIPYDTRVQLNRKSYLPFATASDNSIAADPLAQYHTSAFQEQQSFYGALYPGEGYTYFSGGEYISDANQRSSRSYVPGKSQIGQGRGATTKAILNNASEIRIWSLDGNSMPVSSGFYPADQLTGTVRTNDEGGEVYDYLGKDGKPVCHKVYLQDNAVGGGGAVPSYGITYYVYDNLGRLRYTIPPKATDLIAGGTLSQAILDDLCYQYKYDANGLVIESKDPGKAIEEYVYDKRNRLVLYRDGYLRGQNQWSFTIYDALDRPLLNGVYQTIAEDRQMLQGYFDNTNPYQPPYLIYYQKKYDLFGVYPSGMPGTEVFTYTYYDDYSISDPTGSLWDTYSNVLQFTEQLSTPGAETPWISNLTKGKVTGTREKILPSASADPSKTGEWRETTHFYDKKGRAFYSLSRDIYQGNTIHADYAGVQYDFADRPLISKHVMDNMNSIGGTRHTEWGRSIYDVNSGRLTETQRRTDTGIWVTQSLHSYDELGRTKRNVLGNYGEVQDYSYDIRGQLTGVNDYYTRTGDRQGESRTFGEVLCYDYGFTQPRADGQVAGMLWRGAGASPLNAYGYSYDKGGRLTQADFNRYEPPSGGYINYEWRNNLADYTVSNLQYDKGGNIKSMTQRSVKPGVGVVTMDQLTYNYRNNEQSNQLLKVTDAATFYDLGDFNNTNGTNSDYDYDTNGNLSLDNNKGITNVVYNYFNRPVAVEFTGGRKIEYSYDASGGKVQELVIQPGQPNKQTDYIGSAVYQNDTLQYIGTGSGRSVYDMAAGRFKEEYFVKDHLGNVRSVVEVYVPPVQEYLASYEIASANLEGLVFDHMNEIRDDRPGGDPGNAQAGNLNGAYPERRIGTSMLLRVMSGDKVEMNVNNFYERYETDNDAPVTAEDMLGTIINTLRVGTGGFVGSESHNIKTVTDVFNTSNYSVLDQLISNNTDINRPRAYLNYVLFDENMMIVPNMSGAFQANGEGTWTQIGTSIPMEIPVNGYMAVYLSNGSQNIAADEYGNVYFDQMVIRFSRGKLKEEAHYYPHGLPIADMGSEANGFMPNKRKYQSNEYSKELGLNWMDFHNRQYDPQLGRFLSVDPLAASTAGMSPYTGMNNNPVSVVDPLGLRGEYLAHKLPWEFPYPKGFGPTPDKYTGPGSAEQKAQLQAEDDAREAAARAALGQKIADAAVAESTGTAAGGYTLSMGEMQEAAMMSPGQHVGPFGLILPENEVRLNRRTGTYYAKWDDWGRKMDGLYGQSLGYDFRGYGQSKFVWAVNGFAGNLANTVEGLRNVFTWDHVQNAIFNSSTVATQSVIDMGSRLITLAGEVRNYNDYDWYYAGGYATAEVAKIAVLSMVGGSGAALEGEAVAAEGISQGGLNLFKFGHPTSTVAEGWTVGDRMLHLVNQGSAKLNWKQNSGFLRREMRTGNPIFDSYRSPNGLQIPTGGFLRAERNLLESQGWKYNPSTGAYHPPN